MKLPLDAIGRDSLRLWGRWLSAAARNDLRRLFRGRAADPSTAMPAHFLVGVTYACNSRCTHCSIWTIYRRNPSRRRDEMTLAEFERFMDRNPRLAQVVTTGGEVFERDDMTDFWLALDRRGQRTSCGTNAIDLDRTIARESDLLARLSGRHIRNLGVSIDGLGEVHDRIRGTKGNFDSAWRLFQWAREQEKKFPFYRPEIFSALTADNYRRYPEFVEWLAKEGVPACKIGFSAALTSGHYYQNEDTCKPVIDRGELLDIVADLKRRYPGFGQNFFTRHYVRWLKDPTDAVPCLAATAFGYIDPYWNVYPCLVIDKKLGNLRDVDFDLQAVWSSPAAREFRAEMVENPCSRCFNECNRWISKRATLGGLASIALRQAGNLAGLRGGSERRGRI